jgi:uncharacterized membrane protein YqjE
VSLRERQHHHFLLFPTPFFRVLIVSLRDRSISVVLQDIVANVQDIARSEVQLAKTELREELAHGISASLAVGTAALAGAYSAFFLLLTGVYALRRVMPDWAAALTVAVAVAIVAGLTLFAALKRLKTVHAAPRTVASLKENIEWAKQQIR